MNLKHLTHNELIDLYEQEIKRYHYDPYDNFPEQIFARDRVRKELERRLERLDLVEGYLESANSEASQ